MKASKYTILIIPDNSDNNRSFLLTRKAIRSTIAGVTLVIAGLIAVFWYFGPRVLEHEDLLDRYEVLLHERTRVLDLMRDLNRVKNMDAFIRKSLGADLKFTPEPSNADTSKQPVGRIDDSDIFLSFSENLPSVLPVDGFVTRDINDVSAFTHENHYGLDLTVKNGDPVKAAASGFIIFSGWTYNMGHYIILYHGNGYFTIYGHNQRNLVDQRDYVNRGDVIALAGNTGISSGPHLHFEVWKDGRAIDPKVFFPELRKKNVSITNDG
ncbi:MAG: M23 family metallopeptidase [Candidatus Marinimicrobia bacterium]|nr:M23 family metallopeptidase [Candidatus Neomarinimicrobiota bacterium]